MGLGDNLMAAGMARGAAARGKRIAFGDGRQIIWDQYSEQIFLGPDNSSRNPNIAPPGSEHDRDIEWIRYHKGHRLYNINGGDRWIWNHNFRPIPGEIFFTKLELQNSRRAGQGFVVIEPNVPHYKSVAANKQWPHARYNKLARYIKKTGVDVVQFRHSGGVELPNARQIQTRSFRDALAIMSRARLYIGPEGGLHHGAAAVGIPAVVLFGGFIPPSVTGYATHTNLTGGAVACGSFNPCEHCKAAMERITVDNVNDAALCYLEPRNPIHAARKDEFLAQWSRPPERRPIHVDNGESLAGLL